MWPHSGMAKSGFKNPFATRPCFNGIKCALPNCLFDHDDPRLMDGERAAKRQKQDVPTTQPVQASPAFAKPPVLVRSLQPDGGLHAAKAVSGDLPRTVKKSVSPPPKKAGSKPVLTRSSPKPPPAPKDEGTDTIRPKPLKKDPAPFPKRYQYIKLLREAMVLLNDKIQPDDRALHLTLRQLTRLAEDEEEKIALDNFAVYENVVKQRLLAYKKMTIYGWLEARKGEVPKPNKSTQETANREDSKAVDTGLDVKGERIILSTLVCSQAGLDAYDYVTKVPDEAEVEKSRAAQSQAGNWEECERCATRFQVFPDRESDDAALTTGGRCYYHWGKKFYTKKESGSPSVQRWTCCNDLTLSATCSASDTHVFKASAANRLSLVMPFIQTPANDKVDPHAAVCFDCEMGYTTSGLEMMRLTVVSWPTHELLLDVFVRPFGNILDFNTRFSGITGDQFLDAKPYNPQVKHDPENLMIVGSPYAARDLFLAHVGPKTPILGHALENDLKCIRLVHPTIVDTVLLFPHYKGLPYRHGLKMLAKTHLKKDIQQAGAAGHDSMEDAKTTGELIRFKVKQAWHKLKDQGYTISDDGLLPPLPKGPASAAPPVPSMVPSFKMADMDAKPTKKRKHWEVEDGESESRKAAPEHLNTPFAIGRTAGS